MTPGRRQFGCALCAMAFVAFARAAAGQTPQPPMLAPGYRPAADGDERGLWAIMDRTEEALKTSRFVLRDPELNAYVQYVICRLGKAYCPDVRAYVVRTPQFNASMAPNGMMQVWTGLLLRCSDEAQFAAIVGHEMGHYLRRHTLERWRDARSKTDWGTFLSLGLAVAGAGAIGSLVQLGMVASAYSFSRDQEREADAIGLDLMREAGYAPQAAAEVWAQLLGEFAKGTAERSAQFLFATHPEPEERMATLRERAQALPEGDRGHDRYVERLAELRPVLIADELALRQYGRSELVFDNLLKQAPQDGALWFGKGEIYRLRQEDGDAGRALEAYGKALETGSAPPETYRSIVLVEAKRGQRERAQSALEHYVKLKPQARDIEALRALLQP